MKYEYTVQGVDYEVEIEDVDGNIAKVSVNGIPFEVEMKQPIKAAPKLKKVEAPKPVKQAAAPVAAAAPAAAPAATPGTGAKVTAPLPGTITDIKVSVGQAVRAGDTVVILEAMKMGNEIHAGKDGVVKSINVAKDESVLEGTTIMIIA